MPSKQKQRSGVMHNAGVKMKSTNKVAGGSSEPKFKAAMGSPSGLVGRTRVSRDELTQDFNNVTVRSGTDQQRKSRNEKRGFPRSKRNGNG